MRKQLTTFLVTGLLSVAILAAPLEPSMRMEEDPELTAGYFQGDIILNIDQRNGVINKTLHWPDATVYYKIADEFDAGQVRYIEKAIAHIEELSCIRYLPANNETLGYILVNASNDGCYSDLGYENRERLVNLAPNQLNVGCFRPGTIIHELLHSLGFLHEHAAADRDEYVKIVEENIKDTEKRQFDKIDADEFSNFGMPYDYGSVMHYGPTSFSKNGKPTIVALRPMGSAVMGQRDNWSYTDTVRLNRMYNCPH